MIRLPKLCRSAVDIRPCRHGLLRWVRGHKNSRGKVYSIFLVLYFFTHVYFPASGQAAVTGIVPSSPQFLPSTLIAHRVQQSHCSSIFHRVLLTPALALFRKSICAQEKVPTNLYEYALGGVRTHEKLTYTRLKDNLIRHRGDRSRCSCMAVVV